MFGSASDSEGVVASLKPHRFPRKSFSTSGACFVPSLRRKDLVERSVQSRRRSSAYQAARPHELDSLRECLQTRGEVLLHEMLNDFLPPTSLKQAPIRQFSVFAGDSGVAGPLLHGILRPSFGTESQGERYQAVDFRVLHAA